MKSYYFFLNFMSKILYHLRRLIFLKFQELFFAVYSQDLQRYKENDPNMVNQFLYSHNIHKKLLVRHNAGRI